MIEVQPFRDQPMQDGDCYWWEADDGVRMSVKLPGIQGFCTISTAVHRWDGDRHDPTFSPSIDAQGVDEDGNTANWHGWIIDGRASTDLNKLKAAARPEAVRFFEGG